MFTGIIEDLGTVKALDKGVNYRLSVESAIFAGQKLGGSVSVNGVCLTILDLKNKTAYFEIMEETIKKSNLAALKMGEKVNLERAIRAGDRLDGHFVTGHVDCAGKVADITPAALKVRIPEEGVKFMVVKGSVAVDGISLTIADIDADNFTVYLIPHTIRNTTLGARKRGDHVNIEFDILGKYVLRAKEESVSPSKITESFLRDKGFF